MNATANINPEELSPAQLKDTELVQLHRDLFDKYIKDKIHNLKNRNICLRLYDATVNKDNIRLFYNRHISIFTAALLQDKIDKIIKNSTY